MSPTPLCLSPASPSELLSYVLKYHAHPTTLIICSSQSDFVASVIEDIRQDPALAPKAEEAPSSSSPPPPPPTPLLDRDQDRDRARGQDQAAKHALLSSPLYQVAAAKHIRVAYVPTVTHLRAYLSVFAPADSRVPAPPPPGSASTPRPPASLVVYGFLALHRGTSEWSAQGLGGTAAALVELAHRLSWRATIVEPPPRGARATLGDLLGETAPILSGGARRMRMPMTTTTTTGPGGAGEDGEDEEERKKEGEGVWAGRTVEVGRILGRWFALQRGLWDADSAGHGEVGGGDAQR